MKKNILIFSPSARMVWLEPEKSLNPSYWIITYLATSLTRDYNVYTVGSIKPQGVIKDYNGERIDVVVSIGANYNPATLKCDFKEGFSRHEKAFEIGRKTRWVFEVFNPLHINLCVDVRKWFPELTLMFGKEPDVYMTEQEMQWQQAGFYCMNRLLQKDVALVKTDTFFFSGGVKSRAKEFVVMTANLPFKKLVHGGGWEKYLSKEDGYECAGFQKWKDSADCMIKAKYGVVLHEPLGNKENWVTAKFFEYLGAGIVAFVSRQYDFSEMYITHDYLLRVDNADEANYLIKQYGYDNLLAYQNKLIKTEWKDIEGFYVQPFLNCIKQTINA